MMRRKRGSNSLEEDVQRLLRKKRVAYQRELQVCLEDHYAHWDVVNALRRLISEGDVKSKTYKGLTWYFPSDYTWEDVEQLANEKAYLRSFYVSHPRRYNHGGKDYNDYAEFLVEEALIRAGYMIMARNTYYFDGRIYRPPVGARRPGRPPDLDFLVYIREKHIPIGVQVKNRLSYPDRKDVDTFLEMCRVLRVRPLFIVRMAHRMHLKRIIDFGGQVVVFKRYLLQPPFPYDIFEAITTKIGIPLGVYIYTPSFLIRRLTERKEAF